MNVASESDWSTVGSEFRERRLRLRLNQDEIAEEAGMHRDTVGAIEAGGGSAKKRRQLDEALTRLEDEGGLPPLAIAEDTSESPKVTGVAPVSDAPGLIRIKVEGMYGADAIVVEGPVDNPEAVAAAVHAILRRRAENPDTTPEP